MEGLRALQLLLVGAGIAIGQAAAGQTPEPSAKTPLFVEVTATLADGAARVARPWVPRPTRPVLLEAEPRDFPLAEVSLLRGSRRLDLSAKLEVTNTTQLADRPGLAIRLIEEATHVDVDGRSRTQQTVHENTFTVPVGQAVYLAVLHRPGLRPAVRHWLRFASHEAIAPRRLFDAGELTGAEAVLWVRIVPRSAAKVVAIRRAPDPVPPAVRAVGDPERCIRLWALGFLSRRADPRAVPPLLGALQTGDRATRHAIVDCLGGIGDKRAVGPLIALLTDSSRHQRRPTYGVAAQALARIHDPRAVEPMIQAFRRFSVDDAAGELAQALSWMGDPAAVGPLMTALEGRRGNLAAIIRALVRLRAERAVPTLTNVAKDPGAISARIEATRAIGILGGRDAAEPLYGLLTDPVLGVRLAAAGALGRLGIPAGRTLALDAAGGTDRVTVAMGCEALGAIGSPRDRALLERLSRSSSRLLNTAAAEALEQLERPPRAAPAALLEKYPTIQPADVRSAPALVKPTPSHVEPDVARRLSEARRALAEGDTETARKAVESLRDVPGPGALTVLVEALRHRKATVRAAAVTTLARRRDPVAVGPFLGAGRDPDAAVRIAAVNGMARWSAKLAPGSPDRTAMGVVLTTRLKDNDLTVRRAAAAALAEVATRQEAIALVTALGDADEFVRYRAARALGQAGHAPAIRPLLTMLRNGEEIKRIPSPSAGAATALGMLASRAQRRAEVILALREAAQSPAWRVRAAAVEALGRAGDAESLPALQAALVQPDAGSGGDAICVGALRGIGYLKVADRLVGAIREAGMNRGWPVALEAVRLLATCTRAEAAAALCRLLTRSEPIVRRAAMGALRASAKPAHAPILAEALPNVVEPAPLAKLVGEMGNRAVCPALARMLASRGQTDPALRAALVGALSRLRYGKLDALVAQSAEARADVATEVAGLPIDVLLARVARRDGSDLFLQLAVRRLGQLKLRPAVRLLVDRLADPNPVIAAEALATLERMDQLGTLAYLKGRFGVPEKLLGKTPVADGVRELWLRLRCRQAILSGKRNLDWQWLLAMPMHAVTDPIRSPQAGQVVLYRSGVLGGDGDLFVRYSRDGREWFGPWLLTVDEDRRLDDAAAGRAAPPQVGVQGNVLRLVDRKTGQTFLKTTLQEVGADADTDGLTDLTEMRLGTDPARADTDGDGQADATDANPLCRHSDRWSATDLIHQAVFTRVASGVPGHRPLLVYGATHELYGHGGAVLTCPAVAVDAPLRPRAGSVHLVLGRPAFASDGTSASVAFRVWTSGFAPRHETWILTRRADHWWFAQRVDRP